MNIPQQKNKLVSISKPGSRMGFHPSNSMQTMDKKTTHPGSSQDVSSQRFTHSAISEHEIEVLT